MNNVCVRLTEEFQFAVAKRVFGFKLESILIERAGRSY